MNNNQNTTNSAQAAWVALGNFFSFLVGVISPMILSRYFEIGDYGTYRQVMYVYNTLLVVFTLGLPRAYSFFLPKHSIEYSRDIITKITSLLLILGALFSLFLFVFSNGIATALNNGDLAAALKMFSPIPLFLLPTMGLEGVYASFRRTQELAFYTVTSKILMLVGVVTPVVLFDAKLEGAIRGFVIISAVVFLYALYMLYRPVKGVCAKKTSIPYKEFLIFSIPLFAASIWGVIINSANQFFISRFYGTEAFALFSNGYIDIPFIGMVITAITAVLTPLFSGIENGETITDASLSIWHSALRKSARILYPIIVYGIFFSECLITCMYGDKYLMSYPFFIVRSIGNFFYIIPFAPIMIALGRVKEFARYHMYMAFLVVILETICVQLSDNCIFIAISSEITRILLVTLLVRFIAKRSNTSLSRLLDIRDLLRIILTASISCTLVYPITYVLDNKWIILFCSFVLFCLSYLAVCHITKITYKEMLVGITSRIPSIVYKLIP